MVGKESARRRVCQWKREREYTWTLEGGERGILRKEYMKKFEFESERGNARERERERESNRHWLLTLLKKCLPNYGFLLLLSLSLNVFFKSIFQKIRPKVYFCLASITAHLFLCWPNRLHCWDFFPFSLLLHMGFEPSSEKKYTDPGPS